MRPRRYPVPPSAVRVASWLLLVCGTVAAADAWASVLAIWHVNEAGPPYAASGGGFGGDLSPDVRAMLRYDVTVAIAAGLLLGPLALAIRRAWPLARYAAWSVASLVLVVLLCGLGGGPDGVVSAATHVEQLAWRDALSVLLPGWYSPVHTAAVVALVAGVSAVTMLLLHGSASEYYRLGREGGDLALYTYVRR
jgi:hypothetical protein